jgi:hemoglobin
MHDIYTMQDVMVLVDAFYAKARKNELIGPIFNEIIGDQWPAHLEKMYRFWQTALLEETTYFGRPFPPHATMPVEKKHFDEWVQLFNETVDELFKGPKADESKWRADKLAGMFVDKIEHFKRDFAKPLI